MSITLTVPEAAATPDTIQFKLVLEGDIALVSETANQQFQGKFEKVLPTSFRTFQQISWIYYKLKKSYPTIVLPPLPDQPISSLIDDQDYVERKRLQVERFFDKIMGRYELTSNDDFIHFLSTDMSPTEVGPSSTGVLSFLKFNRVIKPNTERGFKSFKPSEIIDGNDQDIFHKHQIYILLQESYYGFIAESLNQLIQTREGLGDVMTHMGDLIIETTQSKYRLGTGLKLDSRETQRNLDRKMQMMGLLMDELGFVFTRQGKEESMKLGDVMIEYKNSLDPLKVIFNARTVKLMDYVDQLKFRNKKRDRSDKLKLRLGINHPEVREVIAEEIEASEELEKNKKDFDEYQEKVKKEIRLFEKQKSKDIKKSIKDYVDLSIRYERLKLSNLEKTLQDMQQPVIKAPFNYSVSPSHSVFDSSSSSVASSSKNARQQKKKRQQQQQTHQSKHHKDVKKPLKSSASLPTTRNAAADTNPESSNGNKEAVSVVGSHVAVRDDTAKISLSASYDDRLSAKNWMAE
ncbi:hypothetical protein MUCCIDRAFT_165460 [Mucor lusitanicus CBS 277.49]|uniref:PX domain-containing protein n=1 Tax=Mucor lusitanicus CBS 277.49 TaxID=747725 RepID=A0A168JTC9_MUCCL|nr:hypothetical protein MUCCIDRAFT_165460 [Mucor lusitanicus CBS 277.49]